MVRPAERWAIVEVRVLGQGLATSGGYRRGFRIGDARHSHLIDPRTARPVERVVSASVVAPSAAVADVLATALTMAPGERATHAETLAKLASATFDDPRLQQLVGRCATYSGSSPYRAPATLASIASISRLPYFFDSMRRKNSANGWRSS